MLGICPLLVLLVGSGLSLVTAQAPGDENELCTVTLPSIGQNVITYSPNIKPLMDSSHYEDLLPPPSVNSIDSTWQRVDIDGNDNIEITTTWTEQGGEPCRTIVTVCGFSVGIQNNWLITQFINRTVNGVRLPQVVTLFEYQLTGCPMGGGCQRTFVLQKYERSSVNKTAAIETGRYQFVNRLTTRESGVTTSVTENINFDTDNSGFYLGVQDESTCILIHRLLVYYHVCPGEISNLVIRPETIAPSIGNSMQLQVTANCIANARPRDGVSAKLTCSERGVWFQQTVTGCVCEDGYIESNDGSACLSCDAGTYAKVSNGTCAVCPANSNSTVQGLAMCPCVEGFYRLPTEIDLPCTPCDVGTYAKVSTGTCVVCPANSNSTVQSLAMCPCVEGFYRLPTEIDLPCTQPPSAPTNVTVLGFIETTITLSWGEPVFKGGRIELFYSLWYLRSGQTERILFSTVETTMGVITGLLAGTSYEVFVTAENNITDQVPQNLFTERALATTVTTPSKTVDSSTLIIIIIIVVLLAILVVTTVIICTVLLMWYYGKTKHTDESASNYIYSDVGPPTLPSGHPINLNQNDAYHNVTVPPGDLEGEYEYVEPVSDENRMKMARDPTQLGVQQSAATPVYMQLISGNDDKGNLEIETGDKVAYEKVASV